MRSSLNHEIELICAPSDAGAGQVGARHGPAALRTAGLPARLAHLGWQVHDPGELIGPAAAHLESAVDGYRNLPRVRAWSHLVHHAVTSALERNRLPLLLGGDHSLAIGSISAVAQHCRSRDLTLRVLWLDAHADCNSRRTSPSANLHGMALACLHGLGPAELTSLSTTVPALRPGQTMLAGVRSVDPGEAELMREFGLQVMGVDQLRAEGPQRLLARLLQGTPPRRTHLHVSLDVDVLDPVAAPGTGLRVEGGLTAEEAQRLMQALADTTEIGSVDVMELDPLRDEGQRTAGLVLDLLQTLFGRAGAAP